MAKKNVRTCESLPLFDNLPPTSQQARTDNRVEDQFNDRLDDLPFSSPIAVARTNHDAISPHPSAAQPAKSIGVVDQDASDRSRHLTDQDIGPDSTSVPIDVDASTNALVAMVSDDRVSDASPNPIDAHLRQQWQDAPLDMFASWIGSSTVNGGRGYSRRSQKVYFSMWGKFVKQVGAERAALASVQDIDHFTQTLSGRLRQDQLATGRLPSAKRIARRYLSLLSSLHRHLRRVHVRDQNAAAELLHAMGRESKKPLPIALSTEDEARLRDTVAHWPQELHRDLRDHAMLSLLLGSGIKVSEIQCLMIDDVHLDRQPPELDVLGGRVARKAPLAGPSVDAVQAWLTVRLQTSSNNPYLFPGESNMPLSASTIYRVVSFAIGQANLNPLHSGPSVLRHTFATRQLRAGRPLDVVSTWLGHQDPESTQVYRLMLVNPRGFDPA